MARFFQRIIEFFKSLFGIGVEPSLPTGDEPTDPDIDISGELPPLAESVAPPPSDPPRPGVVNPALFEPVEGVTLEQYAQGAAALGRLGDDAPVEQRANALSRFGLDRRSYDRAAAGWQAKMEADTTDVLVRRYADAFAAARNESGPVSVAANGDEPCTFERFVEIMAAQSTWAEQGKDVSVRLENHFGITPMDYSKYSSYWSPKMGMDVAMMRRCSELEAKYRAKYAGEEE